MQNAILFSIFVVQSVLIISEAFDKSNVSYYVDLIENRSKAASEYEFSKDARMYQADDVSLEGNDGRKCPFARGKGVGGGSLINALIYNRGDKNEYQRWSDLLEDPNWNYENILPYFKKSEKFLITDSSLQIDEEYHGFDGPLIVTHPTPSQNLTDTFMKGSQELGYNLTDYNGRQMTGSSILQLDTKFGKRFDNGKAFIEPIMCRKNLVVLDWSYVTKLSISSSNKKVTGVIFTKENKTYTARCRKEVILSAGAISAPQILLLSGIGPKDHLTSLGIPVIQDLPVGKNLRDHLYSPLVFSTNITQIPQSMEDSVKDFLMGQGSLTRCFPYDVVNWFKTESTLKYPNMEIFFLNLTNTPLIQGFMGWSDETYGALTPKVPSSFTFIVNLLQPESTGTVQLKSSDPFEYPLIDPNLLSVESDVETIYEFFQLALNLSQTEAFRSLNFTLVSDQLPACTHLEPLSQDYWYCYIRNTAALAFHPAGTCMTSKSPESGVVDNKLRVFGVNGLLVADGGVLPFTFAAHNAAMCTMIGEKASDLIKEDHGY